MNPSTSALLETRESKMTIVPEPTTKTSLDQPVIIRVGKSLDFNNADDFRQACQDKLAAGGRHFILDFSETSLLDSTGLGAIFSLFRMVMPQEGEVVFACLSYPIQVVVQITGIFRVFTSYPSLQAARTALA